MKFKQLILITGVERSGSTLISRVLQMCDANAGFTNKMRENVSLRSLSSVTISNFGRGCFMPSLKDLKSVPNWENQVVN